MIYTDVLSPQWANAAHTAINLVLVTEALGDIPFTAAPDDTTSYGPEIYERVVAGEFGDITAYELTSYAALIPVALSKQRRLMQDAGLVVAPLQDAVDLGKADDEQVEQLAQWKQYRINLSLVAQQEGWPSEVQWPALPEVTHG